MIRGEKVSLAPLEREHVALRGRETDDPSRPAAPAPAVSGAPSPERARLASVDAFRGLTIIALLLFDHPTVEAVMPAWAHHAKWHGATAIDWIFPSYLLLAGVSMGLSRRSRPTTWKDIARFLGRVALLVALGLLVNQLKWGAPLRYPGVLQRIALASLVAWPLRRVPAWLALVIAGALFAAHAWVLTTVAAPGVAPGDLSSSANNIAWWLDTRAFGPEHTYRLGTATDPEGLLGVLSSAGQMMLGVALAAALTAKHRRGLALAGGVALAAAALAGGWYGASVWLPLSKRLWTPTFALLTSGGLALGLLALYSVSDLVRRPRRLAPLLPLGRNALLVYVGSSLGFSYLLHMKTGSPGQSPLLHAVSSLEPRLGLLGASVAISLAEVALWWALAALLHRRKVYVRL